MRPYSVGVANISAVPLRTRTYAEEARLVLTLGWWSVLFAPLGTVAWFRASRLLREMDARGATHGRHEAVTGQAMGVLMTSAIVICLVLSIAGGAPIT